MPLPKLALVALFALAPSLFPALHTRPLALPALPRFLEEDASRELSGASAFSLPDGTRWLALVADEGTEFSLLPLSGGRGFAFELTSLPGYPTSEGPPEEIDLEGVAWARGQLMLCGSASWKRTKARGKRAEPNRERIRQVGPASGPGRDDSDYLIRLEPIAGGPPGTPPLWRVVDRLPLRQRLLSLEVLERFREVPSKENGLDVEGFAATEERLYFGLRGPVLREHALVLSTDHDLGTPRLHFLHLAGLGIRGLEALPPGALGLPRGGLALLAGPTMPLEAPYELYLWDGFRDSFGKTRKGLERLGRVEPAESGSKPEGLFYLEGALHVLDDGPRGGSPRTLRLDR